MLSLEPLKIVHLVPVIFNRFLRRGHIVFRDWREANVTAILDDGTTGAMQVDVHVLALVHSDLSGGHNNDTVLHSSNMSSPGNVASNDQAILGRS